jgi:uncharacterized membrane protein
MKIILFIFIIFILMFIIDVIWLKYIANDFFVKESKAFGRFKEDGSFDVLLWSAMIAWIVMAIAIYIFVLKDSTTFWTTVYSGLFLGFSLYAVFDFTNYAIIKGYSIKFVLIDILWGTFLVGSVSAIGFWIKNFFL